MPGVKAKHVQKAEFVVLKFGDSIVGLWAEGANTIEISFERDSELLRNSKLKALGARADRVVSCGGEISYRSQSRRGSLARCIELQSTEWSSSHCSW